MEFLRSFFKEKKRKTNKPERVFPRETARESRSHESGARRRRDADQRVMPSGSRRRGLEKALETGRLIHSPDSREVDEVVTTKAAEAARDGGASCGPGEPFAG